MTNDGSQLHPYPPKYLQNEINVTINTTVNNNTTATFTITCRLPAYNIECCRCVVIYSLQLCCYLQLSLWSH